MANTDFETILDDCLARLRQGESAADCLADYPQQAEMLRPALAAAAHIRQIPPPRPSETAVQTGRAHMFAAIEQQHEQFQIIPVSFAGFLRYAKRKLSDWTSAKEIDNMKLAARMAIALVLVLVIGGAAAVTASAQTLPGDALYPVKRVVENVRLTLTGGEAARQAMETELTQERLREIKALMADGRQEIVELSGVLEKSVDGGWQVNGLQFQITAQTKIEGQLTAGQSVTVRIQTGSNGALTALRIQVQQTIDPSDGSYPGPGHTPSPSQTPMPMPTDMPGPIPSHTPMPMTPMPTDMPGPMPTDMPGPMPTDMPGPMPTDMPGPMPTDMPGPMPTDMPGPMPTDMPGPMPTDMPGPMPTMPGPGPMPTGTPMPMPTMPGPMPTGTSMPMPTMPGSGPMPTGTSMPMPTMPGSGPMPTGTSMPGGPGPGHG